MEDYEKRRIEKSIEIINDTLKEVTDSDQIKSLRAELRYYKNILKKSAE